MALITCPECGKEISDQAEACIHCGYPIKKQVSPQERPDYAVVLLGVGDREKTFLALTGLGLTYAEAEAVLAHAPEVVVQNLCYQDALDCCKKIGPTGSRYRMLKNEDLENPEQWESMTPPPELPSEEKKEPMSFGMTVGAVVVGIIAAVFLLSFL